MAIRSLRSTSFCLLAMCVAVLPDACSGQEWSTLKGRIVVTGDVPKPAVLDITRDQEVCGAFGLVDESLLVNPKNQGLQNAVVWLSSKTPIPVHPDFSALPKPVQLDNRNCTFQPRIVKLQSNQILQSTNADSVSHNVAVYGRRNNPFSIVVPQNEPLERSFPKEELQPIRVDCSIHAWMRAHLIITDHPYSAVTDADGKFSIPKLPAGKWEFRFWHERPGYLSQLEVGGEAKVLKRGTIALEITAADLDLGELRVAAELLTAE
jgi:hypothetical protein